jgi:hypothetical protein
MLIKLRYILRADAESAAFALDQDWPTMPAVGDWLDTHPMCGPHVMLPASTDPATGTVTCDVDDEEPGALARVTAIDLEHAEYALWELQNAGWVRERRLSQAGLEEAEQRPDNPNDGDKLGA